MNIFERLKEKVLNYVELKIKLFKLGVIEHTSNIVSSFLFLFLLMFIGTTVLLFLGLFFSEWIYTLVHTRSIAYLLTAVAFVFLLVLLLLLRKKITKFFSDMFVAMLTEQNENDAAS
jgi:ABC-type phosphate/phosphonate transport system permease subunit